MSLGPRRGSIVAAEPPGSRDPDSLRAAWDLRCDVVHEAQQHVRTGLEWREHEPARSSSRNLQGPAEVADRRGERGQAMEHLDRAGELFSRHGTKLCLDQVLAKKQI